MTRTLLTALAILWFLAGALAGRTLATTPRPDRTCVVSSVAEGWPSGKAPVPKTGDIGKRCGGSIPPPSATDGWLNGQGARPLTGSAKAGAGSTPAPSATPSPGPVATAPATRPFAVSGLRITWYCATSRSRCTVGYGPDCLCAAGSPDLFRKGELVTVTANGRSVTVRIVDCLCSSSGIDLYARPFAMLAPLSRGVLWGTWRG